METNNTFFIDIESDGLLHIGSRIHCLGIRVPDSKMMVLGLGEHVMSLKSEVIKEAKFRFAGWELAVVPLEEAWDSFLVPFIEKGHTVVGHNLIGFDYPFCTKFLNRPTKEWFKSTFDTMVAARLQYPDRFERDAGKNVIPSKMWGSHSLKAWGHRLGVQKDDYGDNRTDWSEVSVDMLLYCLQDLAVTEALFKHLNPPERAMKLEMEFSEYIQRQTENGFMFDEVAAGELYGRLVQRRNELTEQLRAVFPDELLQMKTKVKHIPFNPGSRQQIADRLKKLGWVPTELSETGLAKVEEDILISLPYPEAKLCAEYLTNQKRIGQIAEGEHAWMKLSRQGRIHGEVITLGTVTSRCAHRNPNMGQVPSEAEYRSLFKVATGNKLVGVDCSGLQLRCLAHYMAPHDDGDYIKEILSGDIHTKNQKAAGLPTRNDAKTFIYAFLFGAGAVKLGSIIGGGKAAGAALRAKFLKALPALSRIVDGVQQRARAEGFLTGLDGRRLPIRSPHAALNTLLMAAEAVIVKTFTVEMNRMLEFNNINFKQVVHVHDELQFEVLEADSPKIAEMAKVCIKKTTEILNFRCPLAVDTKVGNNWWETH